jgi:hypothetical protein
MDGLKSSENPERMLLQILAKFGLDPTNKMSALCDVCCVQANSLTLGGAVFLEELQNNSLSPHTFCCEACIDYVIDPEHKPRNKQQERAKKHKVGTNPKSMVEFDKSKTFEQNVLEYKQTNRDTEWNVMIEESGKELKENSTFRNRGFLKSCNGCKEFTHSQLLVCSGCKLARYCNKECQKKDWKDHKKKCSSLRANPAVHD